MTQPPEGTSQPPTQPGSMPSYPEQTYPPQQPGYLQPPYSQPAYPPQTPHQQYGYPTGPQGPYPYPPLGSQQQPKPPYYKGNNWLGRQTRGTQTVLAIVAALVILATIGGVASAAGKSGNSGTQITGSATATATTLSFPTDTPQPTATTDTGAHVSKGQTIEVTDNGSTDVAATLVSVQTSSGTDYEQPNPGDVYVICDVKIENRGSASYDYNEFDFYLLDGNGNISDQTFVTSDVAPNQLHAGTLTSGGHVEGQIVFEVHQGDHKAQMTWQPSYGSPKDKFTWSLGL